MDTSLSAKHASINVPLSSQEQWENFVNHHCGEWRGLLLRYDGTGRVLDVLDSVRRLIPSEDQTTVTHALDFRSRITEAVRQKQWVLTPGDPLIIHPVDPTAYLLFNPTPSDMMVGNERTSPEGFYFEPYLITGDRRISLVVMYKEESPQPNLFSFFRESRGAEPTWWTEETQLGDQCIVDQVSRLSFAKSPSTYISLDEMAQIPIVGQELDIEGDLQQVQFPDSVRFIISRNRFETPYYASLQWSIEPNQTPRSCSLIYSQAGQKARIIPG